MWGRRCRSAPPAVEHLDGTATRPGRRDDWTWGIGPRGGPDHGFVAVVRDEDAGRLVELVSAVPLDGFVLDEEESAEEPEAVRTWYDEGTHEKVRAQRAAGERTNLYITDEVTVRGSTLRISRGYGGVGDRCLVAQTALLRRLASADLVVEEWSVREYYDGRVYAQGRGSASLQAYLDGVLPDDREDEH
jgi:hypothetical protein